MCKAGPNLTVPHSLFLVFPGYATLALDASISGRELWASQLLTEKLDTKLAPGLAALEPAASN